MAFKRSGAGGLRELWSRIRAAVVQFRDSGAAIPRERTGVVVPQDGALLLQDYERGRAVVVIVIGQAPVED